MADLITELRPGSIKTVAGSATIGSYVMVNKSLPVMNAERTRHLVVSSMPDGCGQLDVRYPRRLIADDFQKSVRLRVIVRVDDPRPTVGWASIPSYRSDPAAVLPYFDNSQRYTESIEAPKITEVDFNLGLTFDSAINFQMNTEDGIRAVLDDDGKVIESSSNTFSVDGLRLGKTTKRTLITHTDFRLNLTMKPTIVKADTQGR